MHTFLGLPSFSLSRTITCNCSVYYYDCSISDDDTGQTQLTTRDITDLAICMYFKLQAFEYNKKHEGSRIKNSDHLFRVLERAENGTILLQTDERQASHHAEPVDSLLLILFPLLKLGRFARATSPFLSSFGNSVGLAPRLLAIVVVTSGRILYGSKYASSSATPARRRSSSMIRNDPSMIALCTKTY